MMGNDIAYGQKIDKCIRRKMSKPFIGILVFCALTLAVSFFLDRYVDYKRDLYRAVALILHYLGNDLYGTCRNIKYAVSEHIEEFYNTLITINTILAATVIFYYSIQDNRKEGIPHRAILAYSSGSYTIPVYFLVATFLVPAGFWASHLKMRITFIACIIISYVLQMANIILILASTSYSCGLHIICNAEIRQYQALCGIERSGNADWSTERQFVWTYLMHHLEQVIMSDELTADKMEIVRELLKTPYYEKEISFWKRWMKSNGYIGDMAVNCLWENNLKQIYEFYYGNLSAAMEYLCKEENSSERNKVYLVLYEFLRNLQALYKKAEEHKGAMLNYMMTTAGIMNAILDSRTPDAEGFCNYVLNECITEDGIRQKQIGLYFLFQEYLYRTYKGSEDDVPSMFMNHIDRIDKVRTWSMDRDDERLYYDFWQIWMEWTTIPEKNRREYFRVAMAALRRENYSSCPVGYIMLSIRWMEREAHENKDNSADQ